MTEHKALGENAQKPGRHDAMRHIVPSNFSSHQVITFQALKAQGFLQGDSIESRFCKSEDPPPVRLRVFYDARTFSNQSNSISDVMRLGGVLVP